MTGLANEAALLFVATGLETGAALSLRAGSTARRAAGLEGDAAAGCGTGADVAGPCGTYRACAAVGAGSTAAGGVSTGAVDAPTAPRAEPQALQNFAEVEFGALHFGQVVVDSGAISAAGAATTAGATFAPHERQNFAATGTSAPQLAHRMLVCMALPSSG